MSSKLSILILVLLCFKETKVKAQSLDSLKQGDTLALVAYYEDAACNHSEFLLIIKINDGLLGVYSKSPLYCEPNPDIRWDRKIYKESKKLTPADSVSIIKYMKDFITAKKSHQFDDQTNIGNEFVIKGKGIRIPLNDCTNQDWKQFGVMVCSIFNL